MDLLAAITGDLRLAVPAWGCAVLMAVGVAYLVFGSAWPRLFDVLSMTVLGCMAGLVACPWVPLWQPAVIILGGLLLGGLTAFFRNVCHALLSAAVLATVLASLAALAVGPKGFVLYLAMNRYSVPISGPNLACDAVLAAAIVGLLAGATVAVWKFAFSERLITSAQGAALIVFGLASLITTYRGEGPPSIATAFPLTVGALWLCLVVIGVLAQEEVARRRQRWQEPDAPEELEEP